MDTDGVLTKPHHLPVLQEILLFLIVQIPLGVKRRMRNKKPPARSAIGVDAATGTLGQGGVSSVSLSRRFVGQERVWTKALMGDRCRVYSTPMPNFNLSAPLSQPSAK